MNNTYYFSHDYNTRSDQKIKMLIRKHGMEGYGIFWTLIEDLYQNENSLKTDFEGLAYDYRCSPEKVKSIITDFDLFVFEDETFRSHSVQRRLNERGLKSKKARESAKLRWDKEKINANAMQTQCEGIAVKERKGKNNEKKGQDKKVSEKHTPSPLRVLISELFDFLDGNQHWKEQVCMNTNTSMLQVKEGIAEFVARQKAENIQWKYTQDAYSHFANWYRIQTEKERREKNDRAKNNRRSDTATQATDDDFRAAIAAGLARGLQERDQHLQ